MNFLAHCYLSCSNEDILIGNFITDFISKKQSDTYSGDVKLGIELHRKIDAFTDTHEASLELRKMLRANHGKYAPVVVDLVWDYYLCLNWSLYSGNALPIFTSDIYKIINKNKALLPPKLESKIDGMIADDFLLAYADEKRMRRSLQWMDNRVKYPSKFYAMADDIKMNHDHFNALFKNFFPDLIAYVDLHCEC